MRTVYIDFPPACDLWKLQDAMENSKEFDSVKLTAYDGFIGCEVYWKDIAPARMFMIGWIAGAMAS